MMMNLRSERNESILQGLLITFIWVGAMFAGYFYEVSFLVSNSVLFLALGMLLWRGKRVQLHLDWPHGLLAFLVLLYWSTCFYAINLEGAIVEASRISVVLPLAVFMTVLPEAKRWIVLKQWAWMGAFLTVWGWCFQLFRDGRLESTLGYANVLAILLLGGIWISWCAFLKGEGNAYIILALLQLAGLLQTGSRAVFVLFVLLCITEIYIQLRVRKRGKLFSALLLSSLLAVFLLVISAVPRFAAIGWNSGEFSLRRVYWSDGLHLFWQYWVGGMGGGGWAANHPRGYFVKYVHQFYLQLGLDAGITGVIAFCCMLAIMIVKVLRNNRAQARLVIPLLTVFLLHIGFDIDFSFPLVFGLFIMLLFSVETRQANASNKIWSRSPLLQQILAVVSIGCVLAFIWFAAGYEFKAAGVKAVQNQDFGAAESSLEKSGEWMPWAHSVHFELAKVYALRYINSKHRADLDRARIQISLAIQGLPGYEPYEQQQKSLYSDKDQQK